MRTADSILDEVEEMYDQITRRAYEIFQERGGICTLDLEDWFAAERELLFKPGVHIEENGKEVIVTVRLGKVNLMGVQLLVTPLAMLIQAECGDMAKKVFRTIEFPRRIDVNKAEAKYEDGYLVLTA
jgi:HSP20 family molecular chaperone IbpA